MTFRKVFCTALVVMSALASAWGQGDDGSIRPWSISVRLIDGWGTDESISVNSQGATSFTDMNTRRRLECSGTASSDEVSQVEASLAGFLSEELSPNGGSGCFDETNIHAVIHFGEGESVIERHWSAVPSCRVIPISDHEQELVNLVRAIGDRLEMSCRSSSDE